MLTIILRASSQVFVCMYAWLRNVNFSLTCLVENPLVHAPFDAIVVPDLFDACVDVSSLVFFSTTLLSIENSDFFRL